VVRSGGEVGSSPSDRFAEYEAGTTLKRLLRDVKNCPKIGIDSGILHLRGVERVELAPLAESSGYSLEAPKKEHHYVLPCGIRA
jgi:hypothetical protein